MIKNETVPSPALQALAAGCAAWAAENPGALDCWGEGPFPAECFLEAFHDCWDGDEDPEWWATLTVDEAITALIGY